MANIKKSVKNIVFGATCAVLAGTLLASPVLSVFRTGKVQEQASAETPLIREVDGVDTHIDKMFDPAVVQALPDGLAQDREISVVVKTNDTGLLAAYENDRSVTRYDSVASFATSAEGARVKNEIAQRNADARRKLSLAGVKYKSGAEYDTLTGGFEIVLQAGEYAKVVSALEGTDATAYISEEYAVCETKVVENDVNVYGTGIFDSSDSPYDGTGTVVAVLDTGLDYTHSAFNTDNFTVEDDKLAMDLNDIAEDLTSLRAYEFSSGITADSLYISRKVPYGYDYADKDTDVYPLESEHGTHVSGIILGKDDTITGVAPNAQLAAMKVFSDLQESARWSWILSALEDCITLDVDVINMSLGSSAGFSEESKEDEARVYRSIAEHGISLVAAASNDHNSTYGSEKNGNLGLTSNPDSATIGSPGSYESSLAVASISGVKTPYFTFNGQLFYFNESSDTSAEYKHFVDDIFKNYPAGTNDLEIEYVVIPGIGRSADYNGVDIQGKIALVKRGSNTFEDKARIAQQHGAAGVIIYNNVSGDILMNVGFVSIAVCSISMDDGELLRDAGGGKLKFSRDQVAGPFMSDFSSWGPTPDLRIKPEITAHGGDILSAVPGQEYERLSGTSMASPNQAGVTALIRQYVKEKFNLSANDTATRLKVLSTVNRIMMSTTDIARNTNGLPYSVRKQGAGLANLTKATTSPAYITTFDRDTGEEMDKAKIELKDDPQKTGVYDLKFRIDNALGETGVTYDVDAIVMTEGVSETKTHKGATTVTEKGYILDGAKITVESVEGGTHNGTDVTVGAKQSATVVLRIELGDADRQYLDASFENGMYVEGYVTLTPKSGTDVALNVPYLTFYGDWTQAPILDLDYFETQKDELDDSIETLDKTLPDAYATRPIGGLTLDYISYLGAYYFIQDPSSAKISADRKYVSLTNQEDGVNSIYAIWAGMLRGAKRTLVTITDASTGEVIFTKEDFNQRKSYNSGGSIRFSSVEVDFSAIDYDLKNNTKYNVKLETFLDYGEDGGASTNRKNVFEFPFVTDFQSPIVTGCEYYTEYDRTAQKNRLYARVSIYDNHYSMGYFTGYMTENPDYPLHSEYQYDATLFNARPAPIYSEFNSESQITFELTDYMDQLRFAAHKNSFLIGVYDYAMNEGLYELNIPDEVKKLYFEENEIVLSPNQTYVLNPQVYPETEWKETLEYTVADESIISVVGGKILALKSGETDLTVRSAASDENVVIEATIHVKVLFPEEDGYVQYDTPVLNSFRITGYTTDKAFYMLSSSDRDIGTTGGRNTYSPTTTAYALSMFPSEQVTMEYLLDAYYPEKTQVVFASNNESIVRVSETGQITAVAEGFGSVSVRVLVDGKSTLYDYTISVTVKDPIEQNGMYLMAYRGNGGKVEIPADLGIQQIYQYAFSGYDYIPKDENDEVSEEDPSLTKPWYIGEDTITEVVLPEGVEVIGPYAFAGLTALEKVTLPSTITKIDRGAFYGCVSLREVVGMEHVKFINKDAFAVPDDAKNGIPINNISLDSIVAIGNNAFRGAHIVRLVLPETAQSIGTTAFADTALGVLTIRASRVKLGAYAFQNCQYLSRVQLINAYVIPDGVFDGCSSLTEVTLGKDVASVGRNAFGGTNIARFGLQEGNASFKLGNGGAYLTDPTGTELKLLAPNCGATLTLDGITNIAANAFSGNTNLTSVTLPNVVTVGDYAFAGASNLRTVTFGNDLESLGVRCFSETGLRVLPNLGKVKEIPEYAFYQTKLSTVSLGDGYTIGAHAFGNCTTLRTVSLGNDVTVGDSAFLCDPHAEDHEIQIRISDDRLMSGSVRYHVSDSNLTSVTIGTGATIGRRAFAYANALTSLTIGGGTVGTEAFYNNADYVTSTLPTGLTRVDLSNVTAIGARAFSGELAMLYDEDGDELAPSTRSQAAAIATIDLKNVGENSLGAGAFENNGSLTTVLNFDVKVVPDDAFYNCEALASIDLSKVTEIGDHAFAYSALKVVDLSNAERIGDYAFLGTPATSSSKAVSLTSLTLRAEGTVVGNGAFANNVDLTTVANLDAVTSYGDDAFASTGIGGTLDLTKATEIGDFAFGGTELTGVKLGEGLVRLGQNPFVDCPIPRFGITTDIEFNGEVVDHGTEYTYDINDTFKVIDGGLYRVVPYGLELICYPKEIGDEVDISVAEGTVRIGAEAFYNVPLVNATLPSTLRSIGDKAFYGCKSLSMVIFKSMNAPILEEQYDESYLLVANLPGNVAGYVDSGNLGITDYFMWSPYFTTFFFGANFDDYIGKASGKLIMVRPENGVCYDSYIYRMYFNKTVDGATAADENTLAAIAAIAALPDSITLEHEAQVIEARRLYSLIATDSQRGLVYNYDKLLSAENTIEFLKGQNTQPPEEQPAETNDLPLILGVVFGVLGAAIVAFAVTSTVVYLRKKKTAAGTETVETETAETETVETETAETEAEAVETETAEAETAETEETAEEPDPTGDPADKND